MTDPLSAEVVIFNAAIEMPPEERADYLAKSCAGDPELFKRINDLIKANEASGTFLSKFAADTADLPDSERSWKKSSREAPVAEKPGDVIGHYKLLQQIGEGGCGVVYMAQQTEPVRRQVALKVIKLGMDTKNVIARFEAERQALALMEHPNIARVFDAGTSSTGRPFFVMELVRGIRITDFCDQNNFSTEERLGLFIQVCEAIHHAHQKGIIHRDIKPSNILVTLNDGVPLPKVIDFGIAKATQEPLTEKTLFTAFEQFIGTPAYMSPEQAEMNAQGVDTRSDIYSLGVLLYELLTGKTPFSQSDLAQAGIDEMRRILREEEPVRPSTRLSTMMAGDLSAIATRRKVESPKLLHTVRGELDWISMKALDKDRERRYDTAKGLGNDVQRFLDNQPVLAVPPSKIYQIRKLVLRHKFAVVSSVVILLSLVAGLAISTVAAFRIKRASGLVARARDDATEKLRSSYLFEARSLRLAPGLDQQHNGLEAVRHAVEIRPGGDARDEAAATLAVTGARIDKMSSFTFTAEMEAWPHLACAANFSAYAFEDAQTNFVVRAINDNRTLLDIPADGGRFVFPHFSLDGRYLSVALRQHVANRNRTLILDLEQRKVLSDEIPGGSVTVFSPDSHFFAYSLPDFSVVFHDLRANREVCRVRLTRPCFRMALNPLNTRLATSSEFGDEIEIHELRTGALLQSIKLPSEIQYFVWSPDKNGLAIGCKGGHVLLWNAADGFKNVELAGKIGSVTEMAFNHSANLLAVADWDGNLWFWDLRARQIVFKFKIATRGIAFSPDDRHLGSIVQDYHFGSMKIDESEVFLRLNTPFKTDISRPEFSPDGSLLALGIDNQLAFYSVESGKDLGRLNLADRTDRCDDFMFSRDGRNLITVERSNGVVSRSIARSVGTSGTRFQVGAPRLIYEAPDLRHGAFDRDGRHFAVSDFGNDRALVLDFENPDKRIYLSAHKFADYIDISPDGNWVATGSWYNSDVSIWNARTGESVRVLKLPGRTRVAFSPNGKWLVTMCDSYQLWDVKTWDRAGEPIPAKNLPQNNFLTFSPDSSMMAVVVEDNKIRLLETSSRKILCTLVSPGENLKIGYLSFDQTGTRLAVGEHNQTVALWDLGKLRKKLAAIGLDWDRPPFPPAGTNNPGPIKVEFEARRESGENPG